MRCLLRGGKEGGIVKRRKDTDFSRGELNDKWLPQKEPDGFNILFDALKNWRPSSSTNFVKVSTNPTKYGGKSSTFEEGETLLSTN